MFTRPSWKGFRCFGVVWGLRFFSGMVWFWVVGNEGDCGLWTYGGLCAFGVCWVWVGLQVLESVRVSKR